MPRGWTELLSPALWRSWLGWCQSWGHRRWCLFWVGERPRQTVGGWEQETLLTARPPEPPRPAQGLGVPTGGCLTLHKISVSPWSSGPKGGQSWVFIGRTDVEAETPILWPHYAKS